MISNEQLEKDKSDESKREWLYHYSFNIDDLELARLGVHPEEVLNFKMLLLSTLAQTVANDMNDDWLFVEDEEKKIVYCGGIDENQDNIIEYYLEKNEIPEDTLYLGNNGIELYSRNVEKIELHKAELEMLSENIEDLIKVLLIEDKNSTYSPEEKRAKEIQLIIDFFGKTQPKGGIKFKK